VTTRGRIAITILLSITLHALVFSVDWLPLPQEPIEPLLFEARFAPLQELKPAPPRPQVRAPRPVAPAPTPDVAAFATAGVLALPEPVPDAAPAEEVADEPAEVVAEPAAPEPPQQLALAAETDATAAAHSLPRRGRISFTLLYGEERTFVGTAVQSWEAGTNTYVIASEAETGGLIDLFQPQRMRYVSQGRITPQGLRPESFASSRTRRGRSEAAQARFDWDAGNLSYGGTSDSKSAALPAGTQDFVSFIFQFVLVPPVPGRYRIPITTGTRFEVYDIVVSGEERIETPLGTLRTLSIKQIPHEGEVSIEISLAAEYRYLPVRIRHYDREGNYAGDQLANEIRISEE
jgi:hypothetical protein